MKKLPTNFTRAAFRALARSIRVHLGGEPAGYMAPTETAAGACGWSLAFTRDESVAGCTVRVTYTLTASVVGSAALPPAAPEPAPPPAVDALFPS
jgi:hypothetical protein